MFLFRRLKGATRSRFGALRQFGEFRQLYRRNFRANNPETRGLRLLRDWLSPRQREQFDSEGCFDVIGCDTGRKYRVHTGTMMNVHELDEEGRPKMGWCFMPSSSLVAGDVMLAQKVALEAFECSTLTIAKRFMPKSNSRPAW